MTRQEMIDEAVRRAVAPQRPFIGNQMRLPTPYAVALIRHIFRKIVAAQ